MCIFMYLQTVGGGCCYDGLRPDIPEFAPLRRLVAHTAHTKWPPSPSFLPMPDPRPDQTKGPLRERDVPSPQRCPSPGSPGRNPSRSRNRAEQVVRFPPTDLWRPHRPSYSRCVRSRGSQEQRELAATLFWRHASVAECDQTRSQTLKTLLRLAAQRGRPPNPRDRSETGLASRPKKIKGWIRPKLNPYGRCSRPVTFFGWRTKRCFLRVYAF